MSSRRWSTSTRPIPSKSRTATPCPATDAHERRLCRRPGRRHDEEDPRRLLRLSAALSGVRQQPDSGHRDQRESRRRPHRFGGDADQHRVGSLRADDNARQRVQRHADLANQADCPAEAVVSRGADRRQRSAREWPARSSACSGSPSALESVPAALVSRTARRPRESRSTRSCADDVGE